MYLAGAATAVVLAVAAAAIVYATWDDRVDANPPGRPSGQRSPFDGERAFRDLERIVAIGPRTSGSEGHAAMRGYLRTELETAGFQVNEHRFEADTPIGPVQMTNMWVEIAGSEPGLILLSNHYETKYFPQFTFVGANDAGSTTAWMLEMARVMGTQRDGRSLWLVFFDGEEAFKDWSETDSLYGSRAFVDYLREKGLLDQVDVLINVDMIGDRFLGVKRDPGAPTWLSLTIWNTARELGHGAHFLGESLAINDDHVPFRRAGIDAINIIDFEYGDSPRAHRNTWHTPRDTIDKVSAGSLQVIGDVIYHALPRIETHLDAST